MPKDSQEKSTKQRTNRQNRALHLYFTHLADELNGAGYDLKKTLKPSVDLPWNGTLIKELIWRPVMKAQLRKESTTQMTTKDIDAVFDVINRHVSEKFGLTIMFPSIESIISSQSKLER